MPLPRLLPLAIACAGLFSASCYYHGHHRHGSTTVVADFDSFQLDSVSYSGYDEDFYDWDTALSDARVEFRVRHFVGSARLRVYDEDGVKIFDEDYYDHDSYWHDDEYLHVSFSAIGSPGTWQIRLEVFDFSGHLYVILD